MKRSWLLCAVIATSAAAQSPDEEKALTTERDGEVKDLLAETNKRCGTTIEASVDWDSFLPAVRALVKSGTSLRDATARGIGGCRMGLEALQSTCGQRHKEYGKGAVAKGVTSVKCVFTKSDKPAAPVVTVKDGVMTVANSLDTFDDQSTEPQLQRQLAVVGDDLVPASAGMNVYERYFLEDKLPQLKERLDTVTNSCGKELKVTVDWAAMLPHFRKGNGNDLGQLVFSSMSGCLETLEAMNPMCKHGKLKKAVEKKIDSLNCTLLDPKSPKHKVEFSLSKGVLTAKHNSSSANFDEQARAFLEKQ